MITEANIRRAIGEPPYSRGEAYWRRGAVRQVEIVSAERLTGEVSGSGRKVYIQSIGIVHAKSRDLGAVEGVCSCPVGYNCKHVAAVLLTVRDELNRIALSEHGLIAERALQPTRDPLPPKKACKRRQGRPSHKGTARSCAGLAGRTEEVGDASSKFSP